MSDSTAPEVPETTKSTTPNAPHPEFEAALANLPTWEDDENRTTCFFRACAVAASVALLAWAQWKTPYSPPGAYWIRWFLTALVFNFLLPLGLVWMFLGQGLSHQDWLREQRNNGWNYGWNWTHFKRHLLWSLGATLLLLPVLWFVSREPSVRATYATTFLPPTTTPGDWALLLVGLVVYMFCWEWFWRGFGLFGMAQGFGPIAAILIQAIGFGLAHTGKPPVEMMSSFAGGLILGVWCWREKSFVPAFLTHTFVHLAWVALLQI